MIKVIGSVDEPFLASDGTRTTLRDLARADRLLLHFSASFSPYSGADPRTAWWADVVGNRDQTATEQFEISERMYQELKDLGAPEY